MRDIREAFRDQARSCAALGSPFMAQLMSVIAEGLEPGGEVSDRLMSWEGDVSSSGQSVPLRLAGGLHAIRRGGDPGLGAVYPPKTASDQALWRAVRAAFDRHERTLLHWLQSAPQTNEVRRSAALIPALHLLERWAGLPIRLSELGCSGGLNLRADRYNLSLGDAVFGPADTKVRFRPDWEGAVPSPAPPRIIEREGVDLRPLDHDHDADRLFAYIWPDQPERLALTAAAVETARAYPARIAAGDAIDWLARRLAAPMHGSLHLVFHTVAWQYFPHAAQDRGDALFKTAGARATMRSPLARFAMEADGGRDAGLTLQVWPGGDTISLGRADFHGRWITWRKSCLSV
ncbi:MAG: DUF2332 family protein [Pseudomonadota bacterium]